MILSKKKECSKDLIAIELEIDRCTVIQEDEDEENENDDGENENDDEENENDDEKEEIKYEKQDSIVNSSMTSLSFRATKSFQTTASFENYLINELQSINKKLRQAIQSNRQTIQSNGQTTESHRKTIGNYI